MDEFLCSHFILKMEEKTLAYWHIIVYYFKKGKNKSKMQKKKKKKKICAMNGEDVVTASNVSEGVLKFHVGDFLLDNAPLYGRPVEVYID